MRIGKVSTFAATAVALASMQPLLALAGDDKTVLDNKTVLDAGTAAADTGNYSRSPFHVTIGVRGGYDDNVLTTTVDRKSSWFTNGNVGVTYNAGNPRTQINLEAGAGVTYYFDRPSTDRDYDFNANLSLAITHKASPRLSLAASVYATYQVEPDFNLAVGLTRRNGSYFYNSDKFSVAFQWAPRFSTVTSYTFNSIQYENSLVGAFEDRFEHTFSNEFRFLLLPTTSLVGEYRFMIVDYDEALRDSTSHFFLAGVDHSFSPRFNISLRGGAQNRQYEVTGDRTEPYFEGTVNYALGHRSSLSWTNRYSIEEPDVAGSPTRTTFRTGLRFVYGITPRISSSASIYYQHDENEGVTTTTAVSPAFTEDSFDLALGIRYAINRNFSVDAGYNHTEVTSDIFLREYSRNRYYVGFAVTF